MEDRVTWRGPGEPFAVLHDADGGPGRPLPAEASAIYGPWPLPEPAGRPYVYSNFVTSRDGRVSFNVPGAMGGADVSRGHAHDRWLMGLLRARADAVMAGANTLRLEPEHCWTAEAIFPDEGEAFGALRRSEGREATPLHVFVSHDGEVATQAAVLGMPEIRVLVATTTAGLSRARALVGFASPRVECRAFGAERIDLSALAEALCRDHGVRSLLCEGGPTLYGSLLESGLGHDEFLTLSPIVIGEAAGRPMRPSLVEGTGFPPDAPPTCRLLGVRRMGDYLFLRSRYARQVGQG